MRFYTESQLSARRGLTPEGYLVCFDVPIGRVGDQVYGVEELPDITPNDAGEIRINRPAEEVFAEESMRSFEGKPVVIEHPDVPVTPRNWRELSMGHAQNVRRQGDLLLADLMITDADAAKLITSGTMREISCGYDAEYEEQGPGAGVQRQITGNHIALVEHGRCGPRCAIQDHKRGKTMADKKQSMRDKLRRVFTRTLDEALEKVGDDMGEEAGGSVTAPAKIEIEVKGLEQTPAQASTGDEEGAGESGSGDVKTLLTAILKRLEALEAGGKPAGDEYPESSQNTGDEETTVDEALQDSDGKENLAAEDDPKTATSDHARRAIWQDAMHRASILAPGLRVPTFDSAKGKKSFADTLCGVKRRALDAAHATADGARAIAPWIGGAQRISTLDCLTVDAAFMAASDALARANHRSVSFGDSAPVPTRGGISIEQMNQRNAQFWDKRRGG